jgi:hypothetical protein
MVIFMLLSLAAAESAAPQPVPAVVKPVVEKKICRRAEQTGSRIPDPPVCKTAAQWELDKQAAERMLNGRRDMHDVVPYRPGQPLTVRDPPL